MAWKLRDSNIEYTFAWQNSSGQTKYNLGIKLNYKYETC